MVPPRSSSTPLPGRLDLAGKLLQPGILPLVREVASGGRLSAPVVVELDPTSFCDLACPECISIDLLHGARFTSSRLRGLAQELGDAGVRAVILIGGGEPLAHPSIAETIAILHGAGVKVGLTTNGTLLHRYQDVIADSVSWARVSIDAATSATHRWVRPTRSGKIYFDQIIESMAKLTSAKTCKLGMSFLIVFRKEANGTLRTNCTEILESATMARAIGCDYFEVKPAYDMSHHLIPLPNAFRETVAEQLTAIRELASTSFEIISPTTMEEALTGYHVQPKDYSFCHVTQLRTLLTASGAYVCPYHRGDPTAEYGDPTVTSFNQLWQSIEHQRAVARIDPRRDCKFHCIRHESNIRIAEMQGDAITARDTKHDHIEDPFI